MEEEKVRKYITDLFSFVRTDSILVALYTGQVKRLHCPFTVIAKVDVPLEKGKEYSVEAVKMTLKLENVFIIEGKATQV